MSSRFAPGTVLSPIDTDPMQQVVEGGPYYMQEAREMRAEARHHAGFNVGAVAVASNLQGQTRLFAAANRNLRSGQNPTKLCAEDNLIHKIQAADYDTVHAIYISGPPQPDTQSGLESPTLHSCGVCRDCMMEAPEVDEDTLLVHVHPEADIYELYTLPELVTLHESSRPGRRHDFSVFVDPGFDKWQTNVRKYGAFLGRLTNMEEEATPDETWQYMPAFETPVMTGQLYTGIAN